MKRGMRALVVLAAAVVLLPAAPAHAATKKILFTDGTDRTSWFWNKQVDEEVGGGPISQRLRVRNPQNRDTLPVSVERKELERISAIWFDLAGRGVTAGSTITKAVLTIAEVSDPNEQPAYNTNGKGIQACPIDEFWPQGDPPEKWETAPKYDESACVKGKRNATSKPPAWSFNLTGIAGAWGEDPFGSNNGVMLQGIVPADAPPIESWQINLKIPNRDVPATPEKENKTTRDRAVLTLAFTPGAPTLLAPPPPPPPPPVPPDFGGAGAIPSSDFGSESGGGDQGTAPGDETVQAKPVAQVQPPRAPWYVWMLIPLGLLMWAAVRPLVLEPARGMRPDGPVAAIRKLNAQRRGRPLEGPVDPLLGTLHALQGAGRRIAAAAGGARRGLGRAVGGIGAVAGGITRTVRRR